MSDRPSTEDIYRGDGRGAPKSTGQLVKEITEDLQTLVNKQIELTKQEVGDALKAKAKGAAILAVVGAFAFFALIFLLLAVRDGLSEGLPEWASDLTTAAILLVVGAIAALIARRKLQTPVKTELTKKTIKEDVEWAKTLGKQ